jgi:hypothetical protein
VLEILQIFHNKHAFRFLCLVKQVLIKYSALFITTLLARFPFLSYGYGSEDDSWGLVLNARLMAETGEYSFSRLPGHPIQEFVFAFMPDAGAFTFNLLSALFSAIAVVAFADSLNRLRIPYWMPWAVIFSLIPIFFISGTYAIDYAWAMAFILIAWNLLLRSQWALCGIFLGLAIGCRITSGAVIIGFLWMLFQSKNERPWKELITLSLACFITGMICYVPAFMQYGISFFDTYRLPYPSTPKVIVKGTLGVWGFTGCLALIWLILRKKNTSENLISLNIRQGSLIIIGLYSIAFIVLPQKSAFLLPAVPFLLLYFSGINLSRGELILVGVLFLISPITFGLNISDPERGASFSKIALHANVSGQDVFFDPLTGPLQIENTRRINRQEYIDQAYNSYLKVNEKSVLFCGWWMNQFSEKVFQNGANPNVQLIEFATSNQLDSLLLLKYSFYHLDEIAEANDERYSMEKTASLSNELEPK